MKNLNTNCETSYGISRSVIFCTDEHFS